MSEILYILFGVVLTRLYYRREMAGYRRMVQAQVAAQLHSLRNPPTTLAGIAAALGLPPQEGGA